MTSAMTPLTQSLAAQLRDRKPDEVEAWVQRSRSPLGQDALASLALGQPTSFDDPALANRATGDFIQPWGSALARSVAFADQSETGWRRARAIIDVLASNPGKLDSSTAGLLAQILFRLGEVEEVSALLPQLDLNAEASWTLRSDLANPFHTDALAGTTEAGWLEVMNERVDADLSRLTLRSPPPGPPYTRLAADPGEIVNGDLVTVVMSAYSPDREDLFCAVQAVLDQTWTNLELLIIDDRSPSGSEELFAEVAALDDRVHVIQAPTNAGTYEARNLALRQARGRYMTFHDSDDWAHPQRIATQVQALDESPTLLASRTWTLRAYEDLTMTYVGYTPSRLNASSLLFERKPVEALIGGFDSVRKSGDMEYPLRLKAVRPGSVRDLKSPFPMAITQLRSGSLSRTDATPGWTRWDRLRYRDFYLHWHQGIKSGRDSALLPPASGHRPFPLPQKAWAPKRRADAQEPDRYDVGIIADFSRTHLHAPLGTALAGYTSNAGLVTAVAHVEGPESIGSRRSPLNDALVTALRQDEITLTDGERSDEIAVLIVTDPRLLMHWNKPALRPSRVILWADSSPLSTRERQAAHARCLELWAIEPTWAATTQQALDELGGNHNWDIYPNLVSPVVADHRSAAAVSKPRTDGNTLIGGHHLADKRAFWPRESSFVAAAYPPKTGTDFHFLAGLATAARDLKAPTPAHWLSLAMSGMTVPEFLRHLDFFCYQGPWGISAHIATLEAITAGLPTIVPSAASGDIDAPLLFGDTAEVIDHVTALAAGGAREGLSTATAHVDARRAVWADLLHHQLSSFTGD